MKVKKILLLMTLLSLTGCSSANQIQDTGVEDLGNSSVTTSGNASDGMLSSDTNADFYFTKTDDVASLGKYTGSTFAKNATAPLLHNGAYAGSVSVNFSSYIGDSDWKNSIVVAENIDHAYSVNYNVNMKPYFEQKADAVIVAKSSLVDSSGKSYSDVMSTYWSGFTNRLELYPRTPSGNLETTVQQTVKKLNNDLRLKLELTDTANNVSFEPIYFSIDTLKQTVKNGKCYREGDKIPITSTNDAEYTIVIEKAAIGTRYEPSAVSTTDDEKRFRAIDIQYSVIYNKAPKNNNTPSNFDPYDHNKLNPNISYTLQGDADTVVITNDTLSDSRVFYDTNENYPYSKKGDNIAVGKRTTVIESIRIPADMIEPNDYVKLYLEFPEERFIQSDTEAATFSGRYVTVLVKLTDSFAEDIVKKEVEATDE